MAKKNRFSKRNEKRLRVFYEGLHKDQIAELDENGKIVVTNINRHVPKFETIYFTQAPRFSENHSVEAGSQQEKNEVDYMVRNHQPLFEDKKQGVTIFR